MGTIRLTVMALALASVTHPMLLAAQGSPAPSFRSGVDLVPLDVRVTDRSGHTLPSLGPRDFAVFEDRVAQDVTFFAADGVLPVRAVVLIDHSSSMTGPRLARAKAAAFAFLEHLGSDDQAAIIAFNDSATRVASFRTGVTDAASHIDAVRADGQTALLDAILVGLNDLRVARRENEPPAREALIVLSDGEDSASRLEFEEVHSEVQRSGVIVYSVSVRVDERGKALPPLHEFAQLANDSGGRVVSVADMDTLDTVYLDIANELRHMYRLAYVTRATKGDGRWRSLTVGVTDPSARVRTRAGYFAPSPRGLEPRR